MSNPAYIQANTWERCVMREANTNFINRDEACVGESTSRHRIPPRSASHRLEDPLLLEQFSQQYLDLRAGRIGREEFVDHRKVLTSDPVDLAHSSFGVHPDAGPREILMAACAQCHHSDLDQSISRARFNAEDFDMMPNRNAAIETSILRLKLGYSQERLQAEGIKFVSNTGEQVELERGEHILTMPPRKIRSLTDEQIDALIDYLESQKLP